MPAPSRQSRFNRRVRAAVGREHGAVMVIAAILLVVIVGMAALAIDVGSFYQAQRQAQAAADAGALAGAEALSAGSSTAAASTTAQSLAQGNDPGATTPAVTVGANAVTVNVQAHAPSYLGQIFLPGGVNVSGRAVARATMTPCTASGINCYVIFAMDSSCPNGGVSTTAGNINITGGVHSNSSVNIHANDGLGATSYGPTGSGCTATNAPGAVSEPVISTWPIDYSAVYPACSPSGPVQCNGPNGTPSYCTYATPYPTYNVYSDPGPGIYCAYGSGVPSDPSTYTGTVNITGNVAAGSFIAGTISVSGGQTSVSPASGQKMVFYAAAADSGSTPAVSLAGGGGAVSGDVFAPRGTIAVTAGGNSTNFLEGYDVLLANGNMTITGDGPIVSGGGYGTASLTQ